MKVWGNEQKILLSVARRELGPGDAEILRNLARKEPDWDYIVLTARQHGLIPLLHKHTNQAVGDLLPSYIRTQLKQESVANSQGVLYLASQAVKVAKLFRENSIPTAVLKGPILSEQVYGELALRQTGDIDVLIPPEHFLHARELLESLGFEMQPKLTPAQLSSHRSSHCEIQFMRDDWFTVVDLHWGLTPQTFVFGLNADEVMTRLRPVSLAGVQVDTFSPADLLLYQAMHGAKHLWRRLEWISSVAELIRTLDESVWCSVVERTVKARATRILGLALMLVETLFEIKAPAEVLRQVDNDNSMRTFATRISQELFDAPVTAADSTDTNLYNLKIMDRKRDALVSLIRAIFVPTISDWRAVTIPASLHPLYYGFRPLRLSSVYGKSLWRKLIHRP